MSVLACCRRGCPNVMCDRLSDKYGYLGVQTDIDAFLDSPKRNKNREAAIAYFEMIFKMPRD